MTMKVFLHIPYQNYYFLYVTTNFRIWSVLGVFTGKYLTMITKSDRHTWESQLSLFSVCEIQRLVNLSVAQGLWITIN